MNKKKIIKEINLDGKTIKKDSLDKKVSITVSVSIKDLMSLINKNISPTEVFEEGLKKYREE